MFEVIEVEFRGGRKEYYRNPMQFPFQPDDVVLVEVEKGEHICRVSRLVSAEEASSINEISYSIVRRLTEKDLEYVEQIHQREIEAMKICREKVTFHELPMKLVNVEYQFDMRKLTFYFTADGRVDFRELVKDLAAHFRTRIDLRQIGARDEAKRFGGYGVCGMKLCCTTFLTEFNPITTQMAKEQNLSLNPQKLSGCCNRLKCCLRYELDFYRQELSKYPRRESVFKTPRGEAILEKIDIFTASMYVKYEDGEWEKMNVEKLAGFTLLQEGPVVVEEIVEEDLIQYEDNSDNYSA
ncbi:hypothetical protein ISS30_03305 [bacterium]|nr:hypothetical protein [bacterium]